jgi:hypothetical protein
MKATNMNLTRQLVFGSLAVALLTFGVISNLASPTFAMSADQKNTATSKTSTHTTPTMTKAVKSAHKHITASKQRTTPTDKSPNTSSDIKYGNYANPNFSKGSNHETTIEKRSGHNQ